MPPWFYVALHPDAQLSPAEEQVLIQGFEATFGTRGSKSVGKADDD
jgi:hypothetical protein